MATIIRIHRDVTRVPAKKTLSVRASSRHQQPTSSLAEKHNFSLFDKRYQENIHRHACPMSRNTMIGKRCRHPSRPLCPGTPGHPPSDNTSDSLFSLVIFNRYSVRPRAANTTRKMNESPILRWKGKSFTLNEEIDQIFCEVSTSLLGATFKKKPFQSSVFITLCCTLHRSKQDVHCWRRSKISGEKTHTDREREKVEHTVVEVAQRPSQQLGRKTRRR